ncbi:flagellin [Halarcobacter mediterraneus]|uniref:Flagellin n=1 Tax=Halarcobacter mediterraneus TaxID=2023153 RepID=A0A4Q1AR08_9BACT|nr:flagellin [Halarcobacter mediterraneus]RXK11882.1 flagellin [Halarcobacter mediterraneus]
MELGRIAEMDNAKSNHVEKIRTVQEVDEKHKTVQDDEYKKVQGNTQEIEKNEVILDNVKFGYNKNSRDFFVKVTRGDAEYKYPTEDMMKIKAHMLESLQDQQNN